MIKPDKVILSNRKSLTLKIDRKGQLIVYAPKKMSLDKIFKFINEKEKWIETKQNNIKNSISLNNDLFNFEQILFCVKIYLKTNLYIKKRRLSRLPPQSDNWGTLFFIFIIFLRTK